MTRQPDRGASEDSHGDSYAGPATIVVGEECVEVRVRLEARHEPHDGRLHWFGRVAAQPRLDELVAGTGPRGRSTIVEVATAQGRARARLGDPDMWGRLRLSGTGRPPFALDL